MEMLFLLVVVLVVSPILIGIWKLRGHFGGRGSSEATTKDRRECLDRRQGPSAARVDRREGPRRENEIAETFVDQLKGGSR